MSFFGIGQHGITLKELLENPKLQTAPNLNDQGNKKSKDGNAVFDPTSAFLGPNLWNSNGLQDDDFQLEYMDLDEFLSENGIPAGLNENSVGNESDQSQKSPARLSNGQPSSPPIAKRNPMISGPVSPPVARSNPMINSPQSPHVEAININAVFNKEIESPEKVSSPVSSPGVRSLLTIDHMTPEDEDIYSSALSPCSSVVSESPSQVSVEFEVDDQDIALASVPGHNFDPKRRRFTVEELKPQPIIKKSRKIFVPDDCKDDKYWNRRSKNNVAAKRSRDARRIKENQIAMRASFLEKENETLKKELERFKTENVTLKTSLSKYESVGCD